MTGPNDCGIGLTTVPGLFRHGRGIDMALPCVRTNPRFHALLSAFKAKTGCPVLVNTSFNVRGEPIACSPADAFRCLMGTEIEILVIGSCILYKDH